MASSKINVDKITPYVLKSQWHRAYTNLADAHTWIENNWDTLTQAVLNVVIFNNSSALVIAAPSLNPNGTKRDGYGFALFICYDKTAIETVRAINYVFTWGGVKLKRLLAERLLLSGGRHDGCDQKTEVPRYRSSFTDCRLQQRRIEHPVLRVLWSFERSYIIRDILSIENTNWIRSASRYISRWISRMDSFYQCQWNMAKTGICNINGLEVA